MSAAAAIKVTVNTEERLEAGGASSSALIGAIDQGTSSTRFLVFSKTGVILASAQMEHRQIFPAGEDKVG